MSDKNTGFVQLLCTFMCIILCASIFLGSGKRFYNVVDDLYGYFSDVAGVFEIGGLTNHLTVKSVGYVIYGTYPDCRYYFVFEYPQTLQRFRKYTSLSDRRQSSRYVAKFSLNTDDAGNSVYILDGVGTSLTNTYDARDGFNNLKFEDVFLLNNHYLTRDDFITLGFYNFSFDGSKFYVECEYGSYSFAPRNMGNGLAGGR